jgi:hypothetical protein
MIATVVMPEGLAVVRARVNAKGLPQRPALEICRDRCYTARPSHRENFSPG